MGKKSDDVKEVEILNVETSVYLKSRAFIAMTEKQMKEYVEKLDIEVKLVKKTLKRSHCFVDVGSVENAQKLISALNQKKYQKSVVIASMVEKSNPSGNKNVAKTKDGLTILDRLLCMRGISKFVSKRTVLDLFKKAESVVLPSQKNNSLRDAIVVFHKAGDVNNAIREFQGAELGGLKLNLERLVSVPAEVCDEADQPKTEEKKGVKKNKKGETVEAAKDEKNNKRKAEEMDEDDDDDNSDEDMEEEDGEDSDDDIDDDDSDDEGVSYEMVGDEDMDSDVDDDEEEEEEEEEKVVKPLKKKQKKN